MDDPGGGFFGQCVIQGSSLAIDLVFDGHGEAAGIASGHAGVTQRGDHPLARLTFCITISFNELKKWRALDLFGAEKHAAKIAGRNETRQE